MMDYVNSKSLCYHYDGLGSVIAVTDNVGDIVERYEYDVFGKPTILSPGGEPRATSAVGNPYMFTGRRYDSETGLYYYRARYYKPDIGRFLNPDPIGYAGGLNLYTYCGNNPLNWTDPFGLKNLIIHSRGDHSWIELVLDDDSRYTFGLWDYEYARRRAGGRGGRLRSGTDVFMNIEKKNAYKPTASRSVGLSDKQYAMFLKWLAQDHEFKWFYVPTYNCSSWASDTWREITGEDINADTWGPWYFLGIETPEEVVNSIQNIENKTKGKDGEKSS